MLWVSAKLVSSVARLLFDFEQIGICLISWFKKKSIFTIGQNTSAAYMHTHVYLFIYKHNKMTRVKAIYLETLITFAGLVLHLLNNHLSVFTISQHYQCLSYLFYWFERNHDQSNLGEKDLFGLYFHITVRHHGRKSGGMISHGEVLPTGLFRMFLFLIATLRPAAQRWHHPQWTGHSIAN